MTADSKTKAASSATSTLSMQSLPEQSFSSAAIKQQQPLDNNNSNCDSYAQQRALHPADSATVVNASLTMAPVTTHSGELEKEHDAAEEAIHQYQYQRQQHLHLQQPNTTDNRNDRLFLSDVSKPTEFESGIKVHWLESLDADGTVCDQHMHAPSSVQTARTEDFSKHPDDRVRHPTMIFDQSPILCASSLINDVVKEDEPDEESIETLDTDAKPYSEEVPST
ncbi:hypothetical protein FB639_002771, partial [Coemansia asiatica]